MNRWHFPSRLEENRAFCGKSMKLGTHVHYTKTSKSSYSAKPDFACGGCGGHFPKWPLSQKLRGAEPSISTLYIGFVRRRFQKKYCQMYHTILSDIVNVILQNGGHFQSIRFYFQNLRGAAPQMLTLCICFVGRSFQKKYCQIHLTIISAILDAIFQKMAAF